MTGMVSLWPEIFRLGPSCTSFKKVSLYGLAFMFGSKIPLLAVRFPVSWRMKFFVFVEKHCLFNNNNSMVPISSGT